MKLIEYRGFKNVFVGLAQEDNNYFIIYGRTTSPTISFTEETKTITYDSIPIGTIPINNQCTIDITFITNNNTLINIQAIKDKTIYYTLVNILEKML